MPNLDMLRCAATAALDKKAFHLTVLEVTELTSYADHLLICSGASERQVGAIAETITRKLRETGHRPLYPEGKVRSGWVLLDYGAVIFHIFTEEKRLYYGLDNLWGDGVRIDPKELGIEEPSSSSS